MHEAINFVLQELGRTRGVLNDLRALRAYQHSSNPHRETVGIPNRPKKGCCVGLYKLVLGLPFRDPSGCGAKVNRLILKSQPLDMVEKGTMLVSHV